MRGTVDRARRATVLACSLLALCACSRTSPGTYQGYVEGEFVYVASPVGGRLVRLLVERGQTVLADAPLFALESEQEEAEQRRAEAQLKSAEAHLQDLNQGKRAQEVDVAKAQLAQAKAEEQQAASDLKRDEAQFDAGGISRGQLEQSQARATIAAARVQELSGQLEVSRLPARNQQIQAQTAEVESLRAALRQAAWRLDQKRVAATGAGQVLDTLYREGEWVPAGSPIVKILPPGNVKIRFFVPETVAGGVRAGRAIAVRCDGCQDEIPGAVSFVAIQPEYTPPVIYSNETRAKLVFMIEAKPAEGSGPKLHPGQPVEVSLR